MYTRPERKRVRIVTVNTEMGGFVNVSGQLRLQDFMNDTREFIPVFEQEFSDSKSMVLINKRYIISIEEKRG